MTNKQELIDDTGVIHYPSHLMIGHQNVKVEKVVKYSEIKEQDLDLFVGSIK